MRRDSYRIFSEGKIGNLALPNRLVRSATWDPSILGIRKMPDEVLNLYRELAMGGVGLIITGGLPVYRERPPGEEAGKNADTYDDLHVEGTERLADAVHRSRPDCKIVAQLETGYLNTAAVFSVDMAGVGDKLYINGGGAVAAQLQASAKVYSVTVTLDTQVGGSDHAPFYKVGIPASVAAPYTDPDLTYHTTGDNVQSIQPGALRTAGVLSAHALAAWSGGGPTLPVPPESRYLWDWIIPTPICHESRPLGSMTCDHGKWSR